jgi:hypothetical protein
LIPSTQPLTWIFILLSYRKKLKKLETASQRSKRKLGCTDLESHRVGWGKTQTLKSGLCIEGPPPSSLSHPEGVPEVPLTPEAVSVELRPLILWMANTTELLSFVQEKVLEMEKEADQEGELRSRAHSVPLSYPEPRNLGSSSQRVPPLIPRPVLGPTALQ